MAPSPILARRLDAAIELWHRNGGGAPFIVSGGQGPDELASEAEVMARYALNRAVEPEAIILEDKATSTEENLRYSLRLLPCGTKRAYLVTSAFHLPRALAWSYALGLRAKGIGSGAPPASFLKWSLREVAALAISSLRIAHTFYSQKCSGSTKQKDSWHH